MTHASPPEAFVLTGAFRVVCRNPRYLEELAARNLRILLVTDERHRDAAETARKDPEHPAHLIDDIAYVDGSLDQEGSYTPGFVARARHWRGRYTVRGAYAVGETLVEQTGLLCDALGLPGPGLRATRVCRSKYLQRWYLEEYSPASLVVPPGGREDADLTALGYPVVVKPATRHSSSGVVAVGDEAALRELLTSYPDHETVLIEQKVTGQEYSVESLVQHGQARLHLGDPQGDHRVRGADLRGTRPLRPQCPCGGRRGPARRQPPDARSAGLPRRHRPRRVAHRRRRPPVPDGGRRPHPRRRSARPLPPRHRAADGTGDHPDRAR